MNRASRTKRLVSLIAIVLGSAIALLTIIPSIVGANQVITRSTHPSRAILPTSTSIADQASSTQVSAPIPTADQASSTQVSAPTPTAAQTSPTQVPAPTPTATPTQASSTQVPAPTPTAAQTSPTQVPAPTPTATATQASSTQAPTPTPSPPAANNSAPSSRPSGSYTKWWATTFGNAPGYIGSKQVGTLYANTNYIFCKEWAGIVTHSDGSNHWWLWTDLDIGGQGWVSAYYLSKWGNDEAKDDSGKVIPNC